MIRTTYRGLRRVVESEYARPILLIVAVFVLWDLAIRIFEHSVCKQIAAMAASLGGVDLLVLTGGIGEHDPATAAAVRAGLAWLPGIRIRTIPSQEDDQIARHSERLARVDH